MKDGVQNVRTDYRYEYLFNKVNIYSIRSGLGQGNISNAKRALPLAKNVLNINHIPVTVS